MNTLNSNSLDFPAEITVDDRTYVLIDDRTKAAIDVLMESGYFFNKSVNISGREYAPKETIDLVNRLAPILARRQ